MAKEGVQYIIEGKNLLSKKLAEIDRDANKTEQNINNIGKGGIGGNSGGGGLLKSIVGGNLLARGIEMGTSAMVDFGKESFQAFGKFEQFGVALTTMFHGNKIEAKALSDELVQFAKKTPFELTEIQDATKQLIAYGSTSGQVGDELKMLGDISSGVGAPIGEIAYLYGTARTQGRLFSRDIYQLTGRGIPIIAALAKQFKVSESAVMGLVEKGKVGFPQMQKAMASMTAEGGQFFNMMNNQSGTVLGKWSNLADAIDQIKVGFGNSQSGLIHAALDWSNTFLTGLANSIKYTNDLNDKLKNLHVEFKYGENIDALKGRDLSGSMSGQSLKRVDEANRQSSITIAQFQDFMKRAGDSENGKKLIDEFLKVSDADINKLNARNLKSRNLMNKFDPSGAGMNDTEFIRLTAINEDTRNKLKSMRDSFFNKGKANDVADGDSDKTAGTGTTIEAGTPRNLYINITNFLPEWKVISQDKHQTVAQTKEEVGRAFLELVNDAYMAQR